MSLGRASSRVRRKGRCGDRTNVVHGPTAAQAPQKLSLPWKLMEKLPLLHGNVGIEGGPGGGGGRGSLSKGPSQSPGEVQSWTALRSLPESGQVDETWDPQSDQSLAAVTPVMTRQWPDLTGGAQAHPPRGSQGSGGIHPQTLTRERTGAGAALRQGSSKAQASRQRLSCPLPIFALCKVEEQGGEWRLGWGVEVGWVGVCPGVSVSEHTFF